MMKLEQAPPGPEDGMLPGFLMLIDSQGSQRLKGHDFSSQQCEAEAWGLDCAIQWIATAPLTLTPTPSVVYLGLDGLAR